MNSPYLASIFIFAGNFAPRNWAFCQGQLLSIAQNQALFSLLGTTYGGDGVTTFALPDLRGRVPVGMGNSTTVAPVALGEVAGTTAVTLTAANVPLHTHAMLGVMAMDTKGTQWTPDGTSIPSISYGADNDQIANAYVAPGVAPAAVPVALAPQALTVNTAGASQPLPLMKPYLGLNYIIALQGLFPSRN
jgi:microcystin-dependent protein